MHLERAKSTRMQDPIRRSPASVYGPYAAGFATLERGLILSALGILLTGVTPLGYIRSFFEQERLHINWDGGQSHLRTAL